MKSFFINLKHFKTNLMNSFSNNKSANSAKLKDNNILSSFDFGIAFFFVSLFSFFLAKHSTSSLVLAARENFSTYILFEFLLFLFILFLFLSFFGLLKKYQQNRAALLSISKIYTSNIISLFDLMLMKISYR